MTVVCERGGRSGDFYVSSLYLDIEFKPEVTTLRELVKECKKKKHALIVGMD